MSGLTIDGGGKSVSQVFLSYAQVDDQQVISDMPSSCWVSELRRQLEIKLDQKLGRRDKVEIWMDNKGGIRGSDPLTDTITHAIESSDVMIAVMSRGYIESPWCDKERKLFLEKKSISRFFVVTIDDISWKDKPADLTNFDQQIGYPFFRKRSNSMAIEPLGYPTSQKEHADYFSLLHILASDITRALTSSPDRSPVAHNGNEEDTQDIQNETASEPCVFLMDHTPDLFQRAREVRDFITQRGWQVIPGNSMSRDPEKFEDATQKAIEQSAFALQLLGPFGDFATGDMPEGYIRKHSEAVHESGKPVMRWLSPTVALEDIADPDHKEYLQADDVMIMDMEDFKVDLGRNLERYMPKLSLPDFGEEGEPYVMLRTSEADMDLASRITRKISDLGCSYLILEEDESLSSYFEEDYYDGLLVVFGDTPQGWVRENVMECRKVSLRKKERGPLCGIYLGPPPDEKQLRCKPPKFKLLDEWQDLEEFVQHMRERKGGLA